MSEDEPQYVPRETPSDQEKEAADKFKAGLQELCIECGIRSIMATVTYTFSDGVLTIVNASDEQVIHLARGMEQGLRELYSGNENETAPKLH